MNKITDLKALEKYFFVGEEMKEFLQKLNVEVECGRYGFGEYGYVNVVSYDTKEILPQEMEAHRQYIDVHFLLGGEEKIWYYPKAELQTSKEYDETDDYTMHNATKHSEVCYQKGEAIICYPEDAHIAGLCVSEPQAIKKSIVKIPISLLKNQDGR